jgi:hypothetical protein
VKVTAVRTQIFLLNLFIGGLLRVKIIMRNFATTRLRNDCVSDPRPLPLHRF